MGVSFLKLPSCDSDRITRTHRPQSQAARDYAFGEISSHLQATITISSWSCLFFCDFIIKLWPKKWESHSWNSLVVIPTGLLAPTGHNHNLLMILSVLLWFYYKIVTKKKEVSFLKLPSCDSDRITRTHRPQSQPPHDPVCSFVILL